ncbi:hypothetical protein AA313_de0203143 [Arthrobotrys entomopaga]|nr:hypothetical protein AA313_de0203143 [Arthrobotrys entomopaga]
MLFKIAAIIAAFALATTAQAGPLLQERQVNCPGPTKTTVTQFIATEWSTTTPPATTLTLLASSLGHITSTKHETTTWTITTREIFISPAVTTVPVMTTTSTFTGEPTVLVYFTSTSITTLPGTPPASLCLTTTCTDLIESTLTITYTEPIYYATVWTTTTGHVTTSSKTVFKTQTVTDTVAGSTYALTTVTEVPTIHIVTGLTSTTIWLTTYATPAPTFCG